RRPVGCFRCRRPRRGPGCGWRLLRRRVRLRLSVSARDAGPLECEPFFAAATRPQLDHGVFVTSAEVTSSLLRLFAASHVEPAQRSTEGRPVRTVSPMWPLAELRQHWARLPGGGG